MLIKWHWTVVYRIANEPVGNYLYPAANPPKGSFAG
ncbi:MAG: hypothetical protein KatS3mg023_3993 [Armatimonadota bacterium]|nr:MAG: hypothetical protein KatS3mg023_3986 [Armatimonadota bacterium]GIV22242.1 MAG: hypothetical protein KatS3mg023_3993 [Armatimonadota bacterium]